MSEIAEAISGTVADFFGGGDTEVAPTEDTPVVAAPEAEVAPAETPAPDAWNFDAATKDLFAADDEEDTPDFSALADEPDDTVDDDLVVSEYDDDQTKALKKQLLAERKRSEFHERQHLKTARRSWEQDALTQPWGKLVGPALSTIKATSHRDFVQQAKTIARTNAAILKPHYDELAARQATLEEQVRAQLRGEAAAAWGKPSVASPGPAASATEDQTGRLDKAIQRGSMLDATKALIDAQII